MQCCFGSLFHNHGEPADSALFLHVCVPGLPPVPRKSVDHDHHAVPHCCRPFCLLRQCHYDAPLHSGDHKVGRAHLLWSYNWSQGSCEFWSHELALFSHPGKGNKAATVPYSSLPNSALHSNPDSIGFVCLWGTVTIARLTRHWGRGCTEKNLCPRLSGSCSSQ